MPEGNIGATSNASSAAVPGAVPGNGSNSPVPPGVAGTGGAPGVIPTAGSLTPGPSPSAPNVGASGEGSTTPAQGAEGPQMAELQRQLAEAQRAQAEQGAALAAMQRRETRMGIVAELKGLAHPANPYAYMPPQIAEGLADVLVDLSDAPGPMQANAEGTGQVPGPSARQRVRDLMLALARPWPERGERGFNGTPGTAPETAEGKSKELDRLAEAKATAEKIDYKDAVKAIVKERPDLVS